MGILDEVMSGTMLQIKRPPVGVHKRGPKPEKFLRQMEEMVKCPHGGRWHRSNCKRVLAYYQYHDDKTRISICEQCELKEGKGNGCKGKSSGASTKGWKAGGFTYGYSSNRRTYVERTTGSGGRPVGGGSGDV